jgi:hypothetical protein
MTIPDTIRLDDELGAVYTSGTISEPLFPKDTKLPQSVDEPRVVTASDVSVVAVGKVPEGLCTGLETEGQYIVCVGSKPLYSSDAVINANLLDLLSRGVDPSWLKIVDRKSNTVFAVKVKN